MVKQFVSQPNSRALEKKTEFGLFAFLEGGLDVPRRAAS
jgi:hypothetical protein